jgi:hypothetical protein
MPAYSTVNPWTIIMHRFVVGQVALAKPLELARLGRGTTLTTVQIFVVKAFDGTTPRFEVSSIRHYLGGAKPIGVNLTQPDDPLGDGTWIGNAETTGKSYLMIEGDVIVGVVSDGKGNDPGSTTGELVVVLTYLGAPV